MPFATDNRPETVPLVRRRPCARKKLWIAWQGQRKDSSERTPNTAVGRANPPLRLTQEQVFDLVGYKDERIRKILNSDIDYRHFYLDEGDHRLVFALEPALLGPPISRPDLPSLQIIQ